MESMDTTVKYPEQRTDAEPGGSAEPRLLVGPLLRYVDDHRATVWVETDRPCTVRILDHSDPTWSVHGHHYALVVIERLDAGAEIPYEVHLDDHQVWPQRDSAFPASVIRTFRDDDRWRFCFGSCRVSAPYDEDGLGQFGADALVALAQRMAQAPASRWPDALMLVGDQVYADDPSAALSERLSKAHAGGGEAEVRSEIHNFEEYTWLYHESWADDQVRWLLSTVPSCMILDDHDLRDDWNSSWSWRQQIVTEPWWRARVVGAFSSYWVYQHLGNLSPDELADDELFRAVRTAPDDAERERLLAEFSWRADVQPDAARWSYHRDFGGTRLVMVDSRCSRTLDPAKRAMVDEKEWDWVREQALGVLPSGEPIRHLLIGTSLPFLMMPGLHHLEGWNEATAQGAKGRRYAKLGEKLRLALDLEHWAAFRRSFDAMVHLATEVAHGKQPPSSVLWLSGDVHCSYLAEARVDGVDHRTTALHQLTMSPFRNPLNQPIRVVNRLVKRPSMVRLLRGFARRAGVGDPAIRWSVPDGPWFDNGVMTLVLDGSGAVVEVDHACVDDSGAQVLRRTTVRPLTAHAQGGTDT